MRLSRGSPSPLCAERTLRRESPKKVHNSLGISQPDPWDLPEVQFDIRKQGDPPSRDTEGLLSSISILSVRELGDSGVRYVKVEAPRPGSILPTLLPLGGFGLP